MGSVVGTAASDVGTFLGNVIAAPFQNLFGASCEGVCSGTWDVACFIEHFCFSSLARLLVALVVIYIALAFVYFTCKLGIIQYAVKNTCKMAAAACWCCCHALGASSCFLWRQVLSTKRVYRGRRRADVEMGRGSFASFSSDGEDDESSGGDHGRRHGSSESSGAPRWGRAREGSSSVRGRRIDRVRRSLRVRRLDSKKVRSTGRSCHGGESRHHHRAGVRRIKVPYLSRRVHGSTRRR